MRSKRLTSLFMIAIVAGIPGCGEKTDARSSVQKDSPRNAETIQNNNLDNMPVSEWELVLATPASMFSKVDFSTAGLGVVVGSSEHYAITSDSGATWNSASIHDVEHRAVNGEYDLIRGTTSPSGTILIIGLLEEVGSAVFSKSFSEGEWQTHVFPKMSLFDLALLQAGDTWVVGSDDRGGVILHTKGDREWKLVRRHESQLLTIVFVDDKTGWCAGGLGKVLRTRDGGSTWTIVNTPVDETLQKLAFVDKNMGYAVGLNGTILTTTNGGNTWQAQNSGTKVNLNTVFAAQMNEAWVGGDSGILLHTDDGGRTWNRIDVPITSAISDVLVDSGRLWLITEGKVLRRRQ